MNKKRLRKLADNYTHTVNELIEYHDRMAIQCCNAETQAQNRILGTSLSSAKELEKSQTKIKQLEDKGNKVVEMTYLIDGTMDEKDMNNLWEAIDNLQKALEGKDGY